MSTRLEQALADYLALRRATGFRLDRAQRLLTQFIGWLDEQDIDTITIACAMVWATLPADAAAWWWQLRLSAVRGFATYLHARDPRVQIPPPGLIRGGHRRATPMAARLQGTVHEQALNHFVTNSPWRGGAGPRTDR
jgi:hypothetical protein